MKVVSILTVCVTALVCGAALVLSVQPGELNKYWLLVTILTLLTMNSLVTMGIVVPIVLWQCKGWRSLSLDARRLRAASSAALACLVLLIGTYALLKLYVPRRIAFAAYRSDFDQLGATVVGDEAAAIGRTVGPWRVDAIATDPRGGLYLRVNETVPGLVAGIRTSWGFALRPNPYGAPFGREDYRTHALSGEWTWFRATDTSSSY